MIKMLRHNACRPWVLAFMLAAVWSAQASNYKYHFKKIDRRFDAIAERLNQLDFENRRAEANPKDLQQLAQLAGKHPQLQARSIYWQVRMTQFNARPTECIQMAIAVLERQKTIFSWEMRNCYWYNFSMRSTMTNTPANNSYWQKKLRDSRIPPQPHLLLPSDADKRRC